MEQWQDNGIILSLRPHGETGAVISILCADHGRYSGYVYGAQSAKNRSLLGIGNGVSVEWQSRTADYLGRFNILDSQNFSAPILNCPLRLAAFLSACSLCDSLLPDHQSHSGIYHGIRTLFELLPDALWGPSYVMWEISLLKELGFGLDLLRCVAGGDSQTLSYVSPKSGCAVSLEKGLPYRDKLLNLPDFLKAGFNGEIEEGDILTGLKLTGYFLEYWAFAHQTRDIPQVRRRLERLVSERIQQAQLVRAGV